jgi:hypothetical protein
VTKVIAVPIVLLVSCAGIDAAVPANPIQEIVYVSADLSNTIVFSGDRARFGPDLALADPTWPSSFVRSFESPQHVQCVSIGPEGNTIEFAIKRPIANGERFTCRKSVFRVTRCFGNCRAAIIEAETPLVGRNSEQSLRRYLYVDDCRGVLAISQEADLKNGIPLDAPWLQGQVGILSNKQFPACQSL